MSSSEWKKVKLGEIAEFKTGRLNSNAAEITGIYPFFTCAPETFRINSYAFDCEAIILAGNNANGVFSLKYYSGKFNAYQRTYIITTNPTDTVLKFIYYQLGLQLQQLENISHGTATKYLTLPLLREIEVNLPPLSIQQHIAAILSALDDKIELNRQTNVTLEQMAQAIFREWFVVFRYPGATGEMVESELGKIPKDWQVGNIGDILRLSNETITPNLNPETEFFHYSIPAFDEGKLPVIEKGISILSNKFRVKSNSILVSKLNPRIPRIWAITETDERRSICSTEFQVLLPIKPYFHSFGINLFSQSSVIETMKSRASGTSGSHQRIKPQDILSIRSIIPTDANIRKYEEVTGEYVQYMQYSLDESATLAALRDMLLPKLMSGGIDL